MKARLPKGYGGSQGDLLKQAQKMQEDMATFQESFEEKLFETAAGGGMVKVEMTGKKILRSISLDPAIVDPDDIEMLEDLVIAAVNEVTGMIDEEYETEMAKITAGMNIPGIM